MICPCGKAPDDHGRDPGQLAEVLATIERMGELVRVAVRDGESYNVPRIYIALHGLKAMELRALARKYDWEPASFVWGRAR